LSFGYDLVQAERNGNFFERTWHRLRKRAVLRSVRRCGLSERSELLEVGCNTGPLILYLASLRFRVKGVDYDPQNVKRGQHYVREQQLIGVSIDLEDGRKLSFADQSFDGVLLVDVIEHCEDPEKILNEAHRVLKPNGNLIVAFPWASHPVWWPSVKKLLSGRSDHDIDQNPDMIPITKEFISMTKGFHLTHRELAVFFAWQVFEFRKP
jgi:2-polyprenyl-3-methyl-5-hydroxy-6-metoxy-1,4-benzoquinol methylase